MSFKKGFTLIELLVVIAIIAILAAILFPVFAQAKIAAKGAASLSNEKQLALGAIMYSGDSDDIAVPDELFGDASYPVWYGTAGSNFAYWTWLVMPYMKNSNILQDPLATAVTVPSGWPTDVYLAYNYEYGYNYTVFSPVLSTSTTPWPRSPIGLSSVGRPADTVLFTEHANPTLAGTGIWYGQGTLVTVNAEPPDCSDSPALCFTNWGTGGVFQSVGNFTNTAEGAYTGLTAFRKSGQSAVAFGDGHVKSMTPGALAAGTNWNANIAASALVMTDITKYHWTNQ